MIILIFTSIVNANRREEGVELYRNVKKKSSSTQPKEESEREMEKARKRSTRGERDLVKICPIFIM